MYNIRTRASIKDDTTHELEKPVILWYSTNPISKREKERLGFKVMAIFMITTVKIHENPRSQKPSQHVPAASHVLQQRTKRKTWHNLNDRTKKLLAWHTRPCLRMGFLIGYTSQIAILHGQMTTKHLIKKSFGVHHFQSTSDVCALKHPAFSSWRFQQIMGSNRYPEVLRPKPIDNPHLQW